MITSTPVESALCDRTSSSRGCRPDRQDIVRFSGRANVCPGRFEDYVLSVGTVPRLTSAAAALERRRSHVAAPTHPNPRLVRRRSIEQAGRTLLRHDPNTWATPRAVSRRTNCQPHPAHPVPKVSPSASSAIRPPSGRRSTNLPERRYLNTRTARLR